MLEGRGERRALFGLEVDRGTEPLTGRHASAIERKLVLYRELSRSWDGMAETDASAIERKLVLYRAAFEARAKGQYSQLFGQELGGFRVLFTVPNEKRRQGILRLAARLDLAPLVWVAADDLLQEPGDLDMACWATEPDGSLHRLTE